MSNEKRIPDQTISIKTPRVNGKIQHELFPKTRVKLFGAYQFRGKYNRLRKNFKPAPPIRQEDREEWGKSHFRLEVDGKWYRPSGVKYEFFTLADIGELITVGVDKLKQ